jgi:predicted amino acid racemase
MNGMPAIQADIKLLRQNTSYILKACHEWGISLAAVTKVVCADPFIVRALVKSGVDMLADSRVENLMKLPDTPPRLSLRVGEPEEAGEIVANAEFSLQSEPDMVKTLGIAARALKKTHQVILMIDLGDLREGIYYKHQNQILETAALILQEEGLVLAGIGTNLTCYGGILPDENNMSILLGTAHLLRGRFGIPLPIVSGGNSSSLHLLFQGKLPPGITQLRVGEGLMLGMDTSIGQPFSQLSQRVFTLFARLVEVKDKPSLPEGKRGPNAFGEEVTFKDRGPLRRGILAIGRQDMDPERLMPLDPNVSILGGSSDHLIVDLSRVGGYKVGDALGFLPNYGSLLKAYTSPYVRKTYINQAEE